MAYLTNPASDRVRKVSALQQRRSREKYGQFLVEGPQSVREVVRFAPELVRDIYVTDSAADRYAEIIDDALRASIYVHECIPEVVSAMSADAQGLVAVCNAPDTHLEQFSTQDLSAMRSIAILCEVRDPGNAGTVIRAADAAGADLVILSQDSVEVLNPKVVRSTAGSLFHLPVVSAANVSEVAQILSEAGIQILAADGYAEQDLDDLLDAAAAGNEDPGAVSLVKHTAWLFGNEAAGLSAEQKSLADAAVKVPIRGKAESLNLATAATVCLYATSRAQRA